jgi:hypothetical protein
MNTRASLVLFALAALPALAAAQSAPELPSLEELKTQAAAVPVPPLQCVVPNLGGATIHRGAFSDAYKVEVRGELIGTIVSQGEGFLFKSRGGAPIASSSYRVNVAGQKTQTVADCAGKEFAYLIEINDGERCSQLSMKWINGVVVGRMPKCGDGGSFELKDGDKRLLTVHQRGWGDKVTLDWVDPEVDARAAAIMAAWANALAYKRAALRNPPAPRQDDCHGRPGYGYNGPNGGYGNGPYGRCPGGA